MLRAGLWHRGEQRFISGDNPGAGREWSIEIPEGPEGVRYQPLSVIYTLTTSAVAGNRATTLCYASGVAAGSGQSGLVNVFVRSGGASVQIASSAIRFCYLIHSPRNVISDALGNGFRSDYLPPSIFLKPGDRIGSESFGLDAGDVYTGIMVVLQTWVYESPADRSPQIGDGSGRVDTINVGKLNETLERLAQLLEAQQATP